MGGIAPARLDDQSYYFETIDGSLEEAAALDATPWRFRASCRCRLPVPILAVVFILSFIAGYHRSAAGRLAAAAR